MARQGPLRVLAYTSLYPLVPETYIPDEMKALTDNGALLAWCTDRWSPSPVRLAEPMYKDLDEAVREFEPDVLLVYWAAFAVSRLEALSRVGKPFGLRVHSFDFSLEDIEQVHAHPLCIGIWAYPHHAETIGDCLELVPLLTTGSAFPEPASERTIVLAACACLPKKDWPTLVKAFAELSEKGVDCRIVAGVTAEFEDEPKVIRQLIYESGEQVMLSVDVPHDQMIQLLGADGCGRLYLALRRAFRNAQVDRGRHVRRHIGDPSGPPRGSMRRRPRLPNLCQRRGHRGPRSGDPGRRSGDRDRACLQPYIR